MLQTTYDAKGHEKSLTFVNFTINLLSTLLISSPMCLQVVLALDTSVLQIYPVILAESDLINISIARLPGVTKLRCGSEASKTVASTPLFCIDVTGDCLITNATYPAYFNNSDQSASLQCYTFQKPLLAGVSSSQCQVPSECCPAPFADVDGVGCIFIDTTGPNALLPFNYARKVCNSFWPTADLCTRPDNWSALFDFMDQADATKGWMGVKKQNNTWTWFDGSPVNESDWGSYILGPQPDFLPEGIYLPLDVTCAFARRRTGPILVVTKPNLMDDDCKAYHHYVCQIRP